MNTTENIHGHDVLDLLGNAATPLTREELLAEVARRFGPDARFCTCSASDMTLSELLEFLMARGKIVAREGRLTIDAGKICNH